MERYWSASARPPVPALRMGLLLGIQGWVRVVTHIMRVVHRALFAAAAGGERAQHCRFDPFANLVPARIALSLPDP